MIDLASPNTLPPYPVSAGDTIARMSVEAAVSLFAAQRGTEPSPTCFAGDSAIELLSAGKQHTQPMKNALIPTVLMLAIAASASGQTTECAKVTRSGGEVTMIADSIRVVDSIANTLAQRFGVLVNAEEPQYQFSEDLQNIQDADPDWSAQHTNVHYLVPKRRHMEIHFSVLRDGSPADVGGLMRQILEKANQQTPFRYRLDVDGEFFSFVPTATRDANGFVVATIPLLDRRVTIPLGNRRISESANLMADSLSAQTGLRVGCCQGVVAGIPWGRSSVPFEAHDETARSVLERLLTLESSPPRDYWLLRCESGRCFINVQGVWGAQCR